MLLCSVAMAQPVSKQFAYEQREGDTRPKPNLTPCATSLAGKGPGVEPKLPGWQPNGIVVCDTAGSAYQQICSDGQSGAIICWAEMYRGWPYDSSHTTTDVYAQRVDSGGNFVWQSQGVPVCSLSNSNASYPAMISDGQGGAIIAWEDDRDGLGYTRVFAQRLDSLGNRLWPENGVTVCNQWSGYVDLCTDGQGGAIISYVDGRDIANTQENIYAQRIDGTGNPAWQIDGVPVCTADSTQWIPHICSNNAGGAIITWWDDYRNGSTNMDAYGQMINSLGNPKWTLNGEAFITKLGNQKSFKPISDNNKNALIGWADYTTPYTYMQSIDSFGIKQWGDTGVVVGRYGKFNTDSRGGGIGSNQDTVNRIDSAGKICWGSGTPLHNTLPSGGENDADSDGFGGLVAIWNYSTYLYAQRVDSSGVVLWKTTGVPVCTTMNTNNYQKVVGDMTGGAIATWYGDPLNFWNHVWVQRVRADGSPGGVAGSPEIGILVYKPKMVIYPNPFQNNITASFVLANETNCDLAIYNVCGQRVRTVLNSNIKSGMHIIRWNGADDNGNTVSSGLYIVILKSPGFSTIQNILKIK